MRSRIYSMLFLVSLDVEMALSDSYSVSLEKRNSLLIKLNTIIDNKTNNPMVKNSLNFMERNRLAIIIRTNLIMYVPISLTAQAGRFFEHFAEIIRVIEPHPLSNLINFAIGFS